MINTLKYILQRPEKGWDPVDREYALSYAEAEYKNFNIDLVDDVEKYCGGVTGRRILDLGAGPGQYSIEFAKRGAQVFWHDISQNYYSIALAHAQSTGVTLNYSMGYLEDAAGTYDIVFNRICWYYCMNDSRFARKIYSLVKDNGYGYCVINNENILKRNTCKGIKRKLISMQFELNDKLGLKIGHPHPSHKKIEKVFSRFRFNRRAIELKDSNTIVKFAK
jgi:2-polyprenyl-3-methyl-5-hydroxy-6-metoxy-1,4-benzoquinol methylase